MFNNRRVKGNKKSCHYCGSTEHLCRNCPVEKKDSNNYKLEIGKLAEKYVAKYSCPECKKNNCLHFLGNHTPSLDIICKNCGHMIEVKSKCLSINKLPNDVWMFHGNYDYYKKRVSQGLTFVILIYAVDRPTKEVKVRKVIYIKNNEIRKNQDIKVVKNESSNNSKIIIPDIKKFNNWKILDTTIKVH